MGNSNDGEINFGDCVETPIEIESTVRFKGHAFGVESVMLERDGKRFVRDIVRHDPCVSIFAYDTDTESVLLEREFRIGCNRVTTGLPAGYIDPDEIKHGGDFERIAAARELREETGFVLDSGKCIVTAPIYTSEGCSDEATTPVIMCGRFCQVGTEPDETEDIESAWVPIEDAVRMADDGTITGAASLISVYRGVRYIRGSYRCSDTF